MVEIKIRCSKCGWQLSGDTEKSDAGNFDEVLRASQRHANREDHTLNIIGKIVPQKADGV